MIRAADFSRDLEQVRALIAEYVAWLDCDLSFQDFDHEMRNWPRADRGRDCAGARA
jgi:hypothetical protein